LVKAKAEHKIGLHTTRHNKVLTNSRKYRGFGFIMSSYYNKNSEQAGAELCQAQAQLYLPAEPELI
jgi:hypothetical protein